MPGDIIAGDFVVGLSVDGDFVAEVGSCGLLDSSSSYWMDRNEFLDD